jgi:hypothetical protein
MRVDADRAPVSCARLSSAANVEAAGPDAYGAVGAVGLPITAIDAIRDSIALMREDTESMLTGSLPSCVAARH